MIKSAYVILFLFVSFTVTGGHGLKSFTAGNDVFGTRVFIENRGQYDSHPQIREKIKFVIENGPERIFFTPRGLVYELTECRALKESDLEKLERGGQVNAPEKYYVRMNWKDCDSVAVITPEQTQEHYFTYGEGKYNSASYKKITYHGVYNKIDVEYVIPENTSEGIKYNLILHPGANVRDIKIDYSGQIKRLLKKNGDVIIKTPLGNIIEHAPRSYYLDNTPVASSFVIKNGILGFDLPENRDFTGTLIIDPWVTSTVSFVGNGDAYDVDYDYSGNVFIYGGYNSTKLAKYSQGGVLQWTFLGAVPSQTWTSAPIAAQAGNFAVNKLNGKTHIGQGYVSAGTRVIRLDAAGNYDNFINTANNQFQEVWDMCFDFTTGDMLILGGGLSSNFSCMKINPTNASVSLFAFQTGWSAGHDVVSHAIDDAGNLFVIYAGASIVNNSISLAGPGLSGNIWTQPSTYTTFSEQGNKNQYNGGGSLSSNGFNCLAVNNNFLFYYNGSDLAAYSKTTGAKLAATTVPNQQVKMQGGIAVDDCNNLYLGGNGNILCYNFNGTSFTTAGSISAGISGFSNQFVYDVKLDKQSKLLYFCGSDFVGTYAHAPNFSCSAMCFNPPVNYTITPATYSMCGGGVIAFNFANSSALTGITYQWASSSSPQGPFISVPGATVSSYVAPTLTNATYYQVNVTCTNASVTFSAAGVVTVYPSPHLVISGNQTVCVGSPVNLIVSGAQTYTWSDGTVGNFLNIQQPASALISVQGTDSRGCVTNSTLQLVVNPSPTLQLNSTSFVICKGEYFTVHVSGAYSYSWSTGNTGSQIVISPDTSGALTVNGIDSHGCEASATLAVSVDQCVGVEHSASEKEVVIYPNPADEMLYVRSKAEIEIVTIYSLGGGKIFTSKPVSHTVSVNTARFQPGNYLIEIKLMGHATLTKEIVIRRGN
jgi:hypothetical protein